MEDPLKSGILAALFFSVFAIEAHADWKQRCDVNSVLVSHSSKFTRLDCSGNRIEAEVQTSLIAEILARAKIGNHQVDVEIKRPWNARSRQVVVGVQLR